MESHTFFTLPLNHSGKSEFNVTLLGRHTRLPWTPFQNLKPLQVFLKISIIIVSFWLQLLLACMLTVLPCSSHEILRHFLSWTYAHMDAWNRLYWRLGGQGCKEVALTQQCQELQTKPALNVLVATLPRGSFPSYSCPAFYHHFVSSLLLSGLSSSLSEAKTNTLLCLR